MMCLACHESPHAFLDCLFPQSCTCQHRRVTKDDSGGNSIEPSTGSITAQEQSTHAADRLDA